MNRESKILTAFIILMSGSLIFACQQNSQERKKDTKSKTLEGEKNIPGVDKNDLPNVNLMLTRGAFHWDSFELKGNELTYTPSKSGDFEGYPDYQKESKIRLSDSTVVSLINDLMDNGIFEMDNVYENMSSCNSMLGVELTLDNAKIKIKCNDYQRGCPKILTQLEEKLITLHGKGLKRILLPG